MVKPRSPREGRQLNYRTTRLKSLSDSHQAELGR